MTLPVASDQTVTTRFVRLEMSHSDAQHLLTLLTELNRPNVDGYGFVFRAYEMQIARDISATGHELARSLAQVVIPCSRPGGYR